MPVPPPAISPPPSRPEGHFKERDLACPLPSPLTRKPTSPTRPQATYKKRGPHARQRATQQESCLTPVRGPLTRNASHARQRPLTRNAPHTRQRALTQRTTHKERVSRPPEATYKESASLPVRGPLLRGPLTRNEGQQGRRQDPTYNESAPRSHHRAHLQGTRPHTPAGRGSYQESGLLCLLEGRFTWKLALRAERTSA